MNEEIYNLYQKYKITGNDTNRIHHLCAENRKEDAIKYVQSRVSYDYNVAKIIVDDYILNNSKSIEEQSDILIAHKNAVAREALNKPKCPTCSSTNIKKISGAAKVAGAVAFGLFSKTAQSQFKCNHCGYKW